MVSKKLSAVWAVFAFALLAAGGITIAFSVIWSMPNMLVHFVVDNGFLKAGLGLGISYAITFVIALIAIVQPTHVTLGLSILNWVLLVEGLATMVIGTAIWFFTLRERIEYDRKWLASPVEIQMGIQDHFQCCGYFFSNETIPFSGFCTNATFSAQQQACVRPLTGYADYTLNNIFSSIYGYMAIIVGLFLASLCVINKRIEAERFRKIDAKRGGKGFV